MKDAVLTVRLARSTRTRLEAVAQREGRSLSQQVERFITAGLAGGAGSGRPGARPDFEGLAGALADAGVPTLADFAAVRTSLSRSLLTRAGATAFGARARGRRRR